jgi:lipoprotein-releasing system ATP-binding protein
MSVLKLENIIKKYSDPSIVLNNLNLEIKIRESVAVLGASGSGKSTLLHIASMLDTPTSGNVFIDGVLASSLSKYQKSQLRLHKIGFIYQFHHLMEEFDVITNVAMPLLLDGIQKDVACNQANILLKRLGLDEKSRSLPSELSGGQKQRVAIARSLVNNPRIVFADEPTGNLDNINAEQVFRLLNLHTKQNNASLIVITHNEDLADILDRKLRLKDGKLQDF